MTADGLVAWAKSKLGDGYIYGAFFDRVITEGYIQQKARQYPSQYTQRYIERSRKWIGKNAGDCVGLIKGYYWLDGDRVRYLHKGRADDSARMMYNRSSRKGPIATMPERPGLGVYFPGSGMCHVGVYIGGGQVIESRGVDYGVVQTALKSRPWTNWFEVPYIDYQEVEMFAKRGQGSTARPDAAVTQLQNAFIKLGVQMKNQQTGKVFNKADGSYGPATSSGVQVFERKYGLAVTSGDRFTDAHMIVLVRELIKAEGDCAGVKAELAKAKADALTANNKLSAIRKAVDTFKTL